MGKRKRGALRELATSVAAIEERLALRHGFDTGGMLGHDSTYAVNVTEHVALAVDTVLSGVSLLADLVADGDVGEFRGDEELIPSRLVLRPQATVTRRTWIWQCVATMALYNGVYLWNRLGDDSDGSALTLIPVAPSRVNRAHVDRWYIDGNPVAPDELRWVPRMTFPTVTRELGELIRLARATFSAAWSAHAYRADYWETGGSPLYYLRSEQKIDNELAATYQDRWVARRTAGPGRPPVLGSGLDLKATGVDLAATGASNAVSDVGTSVARWLRIPAWLLNVPQEAGGLTYANSAAAGLDLVRYTLQPGYAGPLGDAWSEELPGNYLTGRRVNIGLEHLKRGTALEQAQTYQIATAGKPWMLPSEVRADLHLPVDTTLDESGAPAPALEAIQ